MIRNFQIYLFCLLTFGLLGCSVTRHLEEDQYLVSRVRFEGVAEPELRSGLKDNTGFQPNKRLLGYYPFYLQAWNFGKDGRDSSKIRRFVREKIGEKPVLLDSSRLHIGTKQLELYLFNNGYFNANVTYEVKTHKKKARVIYKIDLNAPYIVNDVEYRVYDRELHRILMRDTTDSEINVGDRFDSDDLIAERDRMTQNLRNRGFYFFSKEFIAFDVDSSSADSGAVNHTVDIAVEVKNPRVFRRHEVYYFDEVYVDVNYPYYLHGVDDSTFTDINGVNVRTRGMPIKPELLAKFVRIDSGNLYRDRSIMFTYNRFYDLQIFGNVRITTTADTATNLVDVHIQLDPNPEIEFGAEPQIITSDQSSAVQAVNQRVWGLSGQVLARNKNLFRGAEVLDVSLTSSAEFQYTNKMFVVSNFRQSLSSSLLIPKLLWAADSAWIMKKIQKRDWRRPVTNFNLTFSYELNKDFIQRTSQLSMAYGASTRYNTYRLIPLEWNLNQVSVKSDFLKNLNPGDRVLLSSLLNPNFIPASRFEWYYNDKGLSPTGNYHKFRWGVLEVAGNLFYTGFLLSGTPKPADGVYKVLNSNLFQYAKTDFDLFYYHYANKDVSLAYRAHAGLAYPYGNSRVVPFDKRFFIGGANSLRGWRPRSIGPGSYSSFDENQIDRSGEIVLEGTAELRFRIITKLLEGAVFVDGGNIWNVHKDTSLPGAGFLEGNPIQDFAINGGIGFRFDFSFFLVRLDVGTQFRDPSYALSGGWVFNDYNYLVRRVTYNFGIGYPF